MQFYSSLFIIWSCQKIHNIFLRHLLIKTCSLAVILFEFFQVTQPWIGTALTCVLKMRSLVCVEYAVECQILFSVLNAVWAFHMRALLLASVPPVISTMLRRYADCITILSGFTMYAESLIIHGNTHLLRIIYINLLSPLWWLLLLFSQGLFALLVWSGLANIYCQHSLSMLACHTIPI